MSFNLDNQLSKTIPDKKETATNFDLWKDPRQIYNPTITTYLKCGDEPIHKVKLAPFKKEIDDVIFT